MKQIFIPAIFVALLPLASASRGQDGWAPPGAAKSGPAKQDGSWVAPGTPRTLDSAVKPAPQPDLRGADWAAPFKNKIQLPPKAVTPVSTDEGWKSNNNTVTSSNKPAILPTFDADFATPLGGKELTKPTMLPPVDIKDKFATPVKAQAGAQVPGSIRPSAEGVSGWRPLENTSVSAPAEAGAVAVPSPPSVFMTSPAPATASASPASAEPLTFYPQAAGTPYSLLADIRGDFLDAAIAQTLERDSPVQDFIMGTRIVGTSQTKAQANFKLIPSPGPAHMELYIAGTTISETVGYTGPVALYTTTTIPFRARKRLALDKDGLETDIWRGKVDFDSQLTGISTCSIFDRIVRKIAAKKYQEGRGQAEAVAREKAEDTIVETLDKETEPQLNDFHKGFVKRMAELKKHGIPTDRIILRSTDTTLEIRGSVSEDPKTQAPSAPPKFDISVRINESLVNQIGRNYAGKTIKGDALEQDAEGLFGTPPPSKEPKTAEDEKPWTITFAKQDPIKAVFTGRELMAVLRIAEFTSGESVYSGMNVTAKYKFVDSPKGIVAVRQGDIEVLPPGFVPGVTKFTGRELTIRTILKKRFGKVMTEEINIKDIELKGDMAKAGTLKLSTAETHDGWLSVAWTRIAKK